MTPEPTNLRILLKCHKGQQNAREKPVGRRNIALKLWILPKFQE